MANALSGLILEDFSDKNAAADALRELSQNCEDLAQSIEQAPGHVHLDGEELATLVHALATSGRTDQASLGLYAQASNAPSYIAASPHHNGLFAQAQIAGLAEMLRSRDILPSTLAARKELVANTNMAFEKLVAGS